MNSRWPRTSALPHVIAAPNLKVMCRNIGIVVDALNARDVSRGSSIGQHHWDWATTGGGRVDGPARHGLLTVPGGHTGLVRIESLGAWDLTGWAQVASIVTRIEQAATAVEQEAREQELRARLRLDALVDLKVMSSHSFDDGRAERLLGEFLDNELDPILVKLRRVEHEARQRMLSWVAGRMAAETTTHPPQRQLLTCHGPGNVPRL